MNNNYTLFNRQSLQNYFSIDEDLEDAVDFLKSPASFRSFDLGLKELLRKKAIREVRKTEKWQTTCTQN